MNRAALALVAMFVATTATADPFGPDSDFGPVPYSQAWRYEQMDKRIRALEDSSTDCDFIVFGAGIDIYSTAWALDRNPAAYEKNVLGFNSEARIALKAMSAPLGCWATRRLRLDDHNNWATGLRYGITAMHVGFAINNFHVGSQSQEEQLAAAYEAHISGAAPKLDGVQFKVSW